MKTSKLLKRISAFVMVFVTVFGLFGALGSTVKVNAATDKVKMYYYDEYFSKYGSTTAYVYVQINDSASNKAVVVHYKNISGDGYIWSDSNASYVTTLSDGSQIWKAFIASRSMEYAVKYVGDGQTYWDNNNGNNYVYQDILGSAVVKVDRLLYQSDIANQGFKIQATLKNLANIKVVKVRYTQDNWATYTDASLSYKSSNTSKGTETWSGTLPLDYSKINSF